MTLHPEMKNDEFVSWAFHEHGGLGLMSDRMDELQRRAEAAEALAADLLESNREQSETIDLLRAEVAQAWRDVELYRQQQATIRELVNAYSEHDTLEAVRRVMGRLRDAEAQLDALKRELSEAFNSGDGAYRP